jgi:hypothetical protein
MDAWNAVHAPKIVRPAPSVSPRESAAHHISSRPGSRARRPPVAAVPNVVRCDAGCGFIECGIRSSVLCHPSSVIRPQSSDNLSQAALALAVFLSLPDSTFPVEDGGAPRKRAIRSSRGGWVENKLIKLRPDNGLTINM